MVRPSVLCISSLQSDYEMCGKDKKSERENLASNSRMAIQTMVPLLFLLLYDQPLLPQNSETMLLSPCNQKTLKPQLNINKLTLAVCLLSGNASLNTKFLRRCPKLYSPYGAQEQNSSMDPVGESGIVGVWNRKLIQFLVT